MRFFAPLKGLPQSMAARLSQIDYEREMALVAESPDGDGLLVGVARIAADPDRQTAEYAILVRTDWKGRGLGYLLLTRIVALAQERGIGAVYGDVLQENDAMLRMCRELGFKVEPHPDELSMVRVTKKLG